MRDHISESIILRHLDYGEADRIVTFFTAEHGRLKGFARGARKSRRRFGPTLEPFARVRLHWKEPSTGELATLREAQLLDLHAGLRTDLATIALAGYGCELVEALLGEASDHPRAYRLLGAFLDHLDGGGGTPEARLLLELRVLTLAGYAPHLLHCGECGSSLEQGAVAFDAGRGGSLCRACAGGGAATSGRPADPGHPGPLPQGAPRPFRRGSPELPHPWGGRTSSGRCLGPAVEPPPQIPHFPGTNDVRRRLSRCR